MITYSVSADAYSMSILLPFPKSKQNMMHYSNQVFIMVEDQHNDALLKEMLVLVFLQGKKRMSISYYLIILSLHQTILSIMKLCSFIGKYSSYGQEGFVWLVSKCLNHENNF